MARSRFVRAAWLAGGRQQLGLHHAFVEDRIADLLARTRCPACGAGIGTRCPSRPAGALRTHAARRARREDLYVLLGCEWCRAPWIREHDDITDIAGYAEACVAGHLHGTCGPCADAARNLASPPGTVARFVGPCPRSAATRALVLCRRIGEPLEMDP
jgi:hypothetical protein